LPVTRHAPICPTFVAARKTERGAAPSPGPFRQATTTGPSCYKHWKPIIRHDTRGYPR
jgi:hypothetical protein